MERQLLTAEDVAEVLQIGRTRVYELIYAGQLQSIKIGRLRRVPVSAVDDFIRRQLEVAA